MPDSQPTEFRDFALHLADDARRMCVSSPAPVEISRKKDNSLVTDVDQAVQDHLVGAIADTYPDHAVCAEEQMPAADTRPDRAQARYCWVIDPIDGTRNYAAGFPCYATSIALLEHGNPIVAVIVEHNIDRTYLAVQGGGVMVDDEPIRPKSTGSLDDRMIGIPSSKDDLTVRVVQSWAATRGLILRNTGSTALHLALVAGGGLDAAFAKRCKIWDVAAGYLLVIEAGGRMTSPDGGPYIPFDLSGDKNRDVPFLAATPALHERLLSMIQESMS